MQIVTKQLVYECDLYQHVDVCIVLGTLGNNTNVNPLSADPDFCRFFILFYYQSKSQVLRTKCMVKDQELQIYQ